MQVSITDSALGDLREIIKYYEDQLVPQVGRELVSKIIERIESLSDHPEIGRIVPEFENQNIRELVHPPFRIVYTTSESIIFVVRVWRSERVLELP